MVDVRLITSLPAPGGQRLLPIVTTAGVVSIGLAQVRDSTAVKSRNAVQMGRQRCSTVLARLPCVVAHLCSHTTDDVTDGMVAVDPKKTAILVGVALVLFYVIAEPEGAAGLVGSIVGFLRDAAESVITFVSSVFS